MNPVARWAIIGLGAAVAFVLAAWAAVVAFVNYGAR